MIAALFFSTLLTIFARAGYPPMQGDALFYCVPSMSFAMHHGLAHPISAFASSYDPQHLGRFLIYPPFGLVVMGFLFRWFGLYGGYCVLSVLRLWLMLLIFRKTKATAWWTFWGMAALATISVYQLPGRPEALGMVWVELGVLAVLYGFNEIWMGLLCGLLAATHPVGGVMALLMASMYFAFKWPWKEAFYRIRWMGFWAAFTGIAGVVLFSPGLPGETFSAIWQYGHYATAPDPAVTWRIVANEFLFDPGFLLSLPFILVTIWIGGKWVLNNALDIKSPWLFWMAWACLVMVIDRFIFQSSNHGTYVTLFLPVMLL